MEVRFGESGGTKLGFSGSSSSEVVWRCCDEVAGAAGYFWSVRGSATLNQVDASHRSRAAESITFSLSLLFGFEHPKDVAVDLLVAALTT